MTLYRVSLTSLAAVALAAATVASAAQPQAPGPLAGAVHVQFQGATAKGVQLTRTVDRGKVSAVSTDSLTLAELGGGSFTFSIAQETRGPIRALRVGRRAEVLSDGAGTALAVRVLPVRAAARQALGLYAGFVHATVDATSRTGAGSSFVYDRGQIVSDNGGTLVVKRRDGTSVTLTVDATTAVRERGKPETIDALAVGERAMFFSTSSGHVFLVRCLSKGRTGSS